MQIRSFRPDPRVQYAAKPTAEDLFAPQPPEPPTRERKNVAGAVGLSAFIAASAAAGGAAGVGAMVWSGLPGMAAGAAMGGLWGVTAGWLLTKGALYGLKKVTGHEPSEQMTKWGHRLAFATCLAGGWRPATRPFRPPGPAASGWSAAWSAGWRPVSAGVKS